ncbi:MAG: shikimate kinase [Pseudomonadota bacterium]
MSSMDLVFIHGPAAAGKYTIGRALSELTGLPLLHNHLAVDAASTLFEFGTPGFQELRAALWRSCFEAAARHRRSFIFTFHPEASVDPALIDQLTAAVTDPHGPAGHVHFVALTVSRDSLLGRLDNASRHEFGKLTDPKLYAEIERAGGFDFPALPEPLLTVDTDRYSAQAAAELIYRGLVDAGADL